MDLPTASDPHEALDTPGPATRTRFGGRVRQRRCHSTTAIGENARCEHRADGTGDPETRFRNDHMEAHLRPRRGESSACEAGVCRDQEGEAPVRPGIQEADVHPDLRRPATRPDHRKLAGAEDRRRLLPEERLPDLPLEGPAPRPETRRPQPLGPTHRLARLNDAPVCHRAIGGSFGRAAGYGRGRGRPARVDTCPRHR